MRGPLSYLAYASKSVWIQAGIETFAVDWKQDELLNMHSKAELANVNGLVL